MFKRKPPATEAAQPADFPIIDGKPVKAKAVKPKPEPEPVVEAAAEPAALPMCPENYPDRYDIFGNPL